MTDDLYNEIKYYNFNNLASIIILDNLLKLFGLIQKLWDLDFLKVVMGDFIMMIINFLLGNLNGVFDNNVLPP